MYTLLSGLYKHLTQKAGLRIRIGIQEGKNDPQKKKKVKKFYFSNCWMFSFEG
jgi:hypothetical protein